LANNTHHGIDTSSEIARNKVTRIYKSPITEFSELFQGKKLGYTLMLFAIASFLFPTITKILFPLFIILALVFPVPLMVLPLNIPIHAKQRKDPNNIVPSKDGRTIGNSEAIGYMGITRETNEETWITSDKMRRHLLYLSTTGGGKSVTLLTYSISFSLVMGSGYSYTDGKAQLDLAVDHASSCLRFNRALDFQCISYITGGIDAWEESTSQKANTFNFYATASYSEISEINIALLDGDNDVWAKRAESFISALSKILVYLRDMGEINLSVESYIPYLNLEAVGKLAGRSEIPEVAASQIRQFLRTIPGITDDSYITLLQGQPVKSTTVHDQFGFVTMQIIPLMNMLAGDYSHIFRCIQGQVTMKDCVINRRILLILLPALEKSASTLSNLGRITLAAQKSMMGSSLGAEFEGNVQRNLETSATSALSPYPSFNDEVGYYFVEGTAVTAAQSRSLWMMMIYCGQDLPALRRLSEMASKETDSVIGNTVTKMGGFLLDKSSVEMFKDQMGEAYTSEVDRMDIDHSGAMRGRHIANQVNMVKRDRVNIRDFNNLIEGEAFVQQHDKYFQIDIPLIKASRVKIAKFNDFIPCPRFLKEEREKYLNRFRVYENAFASLMKGERKATASRSSQEVFTKIRQNFDNAAAQNMPLTATGLGVFTLYQIEINKLLSTFYTSAAPYSNTITVDDKSYETVASDTDDHDVSNLSSADVEADLDALDAENIISIESATESPTNEFTREIESTIKQNTHAFANVFTSGLLDESQVREDLKDVSVLLEPKIAEETVLKRVDKSIQNIADASGYPGSKRLEKNTGLSVILLQKLQKDLQRG
jgi:intracellular multiplication protein IcmO